MARRWICELGLCIVLLWSWCAQEALAQTESGEKIYQRTLRGTTWILGIRDGGAATGTGGSHRRNPQVGDYEFSCRGRSQSHPSFFP